ncbi:hypothetical protein GCM10023323_49840 [Streptomyces thinghirensis]|uniref:Uncharacterized protein n=2 Tax=Streptomyces thinghirensis TaxID=551547 RepID=A0ABP9TAL4_9ACTN
MSTASRASASGSGKPTRTCSSTLRAWTPWPRVSNRSTTGPSPSTGTPRRLAFISRVVRAAVAARSASCVEQVSPRSFLSALQKALSETRGQYAGHEYALHHEGIRRGVQKASETRVTEVSEDMPWVVSAIRPLAGHQVPIEQAKVEALWREVHLADELRKLAERYEPQNDDEIKVRTGPRYPEDPQLLIEELIALGVMRRHRDGRIDLPDVYRIAFGVGRKGGVPRGAG